MGKMACSGVNGVYFPIVGFVSAPEKVPLDSLFEKQGGYLRGISTERPGHEGLLT